MIQISVLIPDFRTLSFSFLQYRVAKHGKSGRQKMLTIAEMEGPCHQHSQMIQKRFFLVQRFELGMSALAISEEQIRSSPTAGESLASGDSFNVSLHWKKKTQQLQISLITPKYTSSSESENRWHKPWAVLLDVFFLLRMNNKINN